MILHLRILFAVIALVSFCSCNQHKIVQKSLGKANDECVSYGSSEQCLARCVTLVTRDWNETVGLSSVYDRFYQPDPEDLCNTNRTQRCLEALQSTVAPEDKCLRAAGSVQCYLDQYGQVDMATSRFVKSAPVQQQQIIWECGAMLGYSGDQILRSIDDKDYSMQETRCLYRCYLIRSGMYTDEGGLNMERFYVACGGYEDEFYRNVTECAARVRSSTRCDDRCTLAQRLASECIGTRYDQTLTPGPATIDARDGSSVTYAVFQNYAGRDMTNTFVLNQR
ncbi:AAEL000833-PA [Aedes aegypti]|uniref:AAEL000833-PA n=1 Tax=Aedes aegypti TaxID=7159 RepID=Q17N09_AEDAE|nr:AAEL000833-PA [Aedes aegypti]